MKIHIQNLFLLPALMAALGLIRARQVSAQTFTTLHRFNADSDGANPQVGVILSGNTLYGTASDGGPGSPNGTVYKVNTDGTGFTVLHSFTFTGQPPTNGDGAIPYSGLILSGNTLYGTANQGGSSANGTVFAINTDGLGFTNLYSFTATPAENSFTNNDGANPQAGLTLSGNTLYGTARNGGASGVGTVFAVNTDGSGFTNLHSFAGGSDGADPWAGLILSGNLLYGAARIGGGSGVGTVFAVSTNGSGFTNLYAFTGGEEGGYPAAGLMLSGNTLYGTANSGGGSGVGAVFAVNTDGSGINTVHTFMSSSDGANSYTGLILLGNTLYGTTSTGGSLGGGTAFAVNTNGTDFAILNSFSTGGSFGDRPRGDFILSGNILYGTTYGGGNSGWGTVFSLSFTPQLTITSEGSNVILTWPTNVAGFDYSAFMLQSTTNLVSPAVWSAISPGPIVVNAQNTVTNPISGAQCFYRLTQ